MRGTCWRFVPTLPAVVSVDADHPDCFGDIAEVRRAFAQFVENCPLAVVRAEDELICKGAHLCIAADGKAYACGEGECSRVGVCAYETHPSLECEDAQTVTLTLSGERARFTLPFPGEHYAEDAAFAVALAHSLGVGVREAAQSLSTFRGVARRFERAGEICGAGSGVRLCPSPHGNCLCSCRRRRGRKTSACRLSAAHLLAHGGVYHGFCAGVGGAGRGRSAARLCRKRALRCGWDDGGSGKRDRQGCRPNVRFIPLFRLMMPCLL